MSIAAFEIVFFSPEDYIPSQLLNSSWLYLDMLVAGAKLILLTIIQCGISIAFRVISTPTPFAFNWSWDRLQKGQ